MSTLVKFHKAASLPGTLEPNAFYFINDGVSSYAESYITDAAGVAKLIGNSVMINQLVTAANSVVIESVADIAARDAYSLTASDRALLLVVDASADGTVDAGAAMYFWDGTSFIKVTEFESLDVVVDWSDVQNGPTSTPAQIDAAINDSHTHTNKAVLDLITSAGSGQVITAAERAAITHTNRVQLDKIGEDANNCLQYDGEFPMYWSISNW